MSDPWKLLNHDAVLNTVEQAIGSKLSNLVLQRNSYINRVYELTLADSKDKIIVKFYRKGRWPREMIEQEQSFLERLSEAELPVIPPLQFHGQTLFEWAGIYFAIFPKKGGRALDELDKDGWELVGRLLARVHQIGQTMPATGRIMWQPKNVLERYVPYLLEGNHLPTDYNEVLHRLSRQFVEKAQAHFEKEPMLLIHGDCHKGNLMHRPGEGTYLIDFDDIVVGPAVQDVWMLLPGRPDESEQEIRWFLSGYELFRSFNISSFQLIPALKVMRMFHFATWCAMQSKDEQFSLHFPEWGTTRYWNELFRDIQEQINEIPVGLYRH